MFDDNDDMRLFFCKYEATKPVTTREYQGSAGEQTSLIKL
jgi:hypothetical protein